MSINAVDLLVQRAPERARALQAVATALSSGDSAAAARAFASATTQDYAKAQASAVAKAYASGERCRAFLE